MSTGFIMAALLDKKNEGKDISRAALMDQAHGVNSQPASCTGKLATRGSDGHQSPIHYLAITNSGHWLIRRVSFKRSILPTALIQCKGLWDGHYFASKPVDKAEGKQREFLSVGFCVATNFSGQHST